MYITFYVIECNRYYERHLPMAEEKLCAFWISEFLLASQRPEGARSNVYTFHVIMCNRYYKLHCCSVVEGELCVFWISGFLLASQGRCVTGGGVRHLATGRRGWHAWHLDATHV
ncbi:hypothetical protein EVJ58_g7316 [Rhodofomes roseus]|uniref:Uncharacterized protein n=1 Tax=Rhodofomes roseus TaxID=34475 RepID=A0A4Y9Y4B4_9APHY|nr:hypothetical protein EVJ58_g7316 [Rhodofomes roseus]